MPNTYTLISSNTLNSTTASVTFSAIPSTYTDLIVKCFVRGVAVGTEDTLRVEINGLSTSIYSSTRMMGNGSSPTSARFLRGEGGLYFASTQESTTTANTFSNCELYIPNYLSTTLKVASGVSAPETNASTDTGVNSAYAGLANVTTAITSLTFITVAGSMASGSSFYLYGIKNS